MIAEALAALDTDLARNLAYGLAGALAAVWYVRERRVGSAELWPRYWLVSAVLLLSMGIARAGGIGDLVSDLGRAQARTEGWYEGRQAVQAAVYGVIALAVLVVVAIWRVPPRRRRYVPHAVVVSTLIAFAVVRLISLHQIDSLLFGRDIAGARVVAVVEILLLAAVVPAMLIWAPVPARPSALPPNS